METAKQVYIDRVNNTSYKVSTIKLYPSSSDLQARQLQERRDHLLTYICASVRQRQRLRENANADELVTLDYYDKILLVINHCLEPTVTVKPFIFASPLFLRLVVKSRTLRARKSRNSNH
jgi:hypothetical protein